MKGDKLHTEVCKPAGLQEGKALGTVELGMSRKTCHHTGVFFRKTRTPITSQREAHLPRPELGFRPVCQNAADPQAVLFPQHNGLVSLPPTDESHPHMKKSSCPRLQTGSFHTEIEFLVGHGHLAMKLCG